MLSVSYLMPVPSAGDSCKGGDGVLFYCVLLASSALAIALALALACEIRLRRALQRLLAQLLSLWRTQHAKSVPPPEAYLVNALLIGLRFLVILLAGGCEPSSEGKLAELAERSLAEQARQNERLSQQSQQIADASRLLVEADAQSRQQMIQAHAALQKDIRDGQASIEQQRDKLELERKEIAAQRHRDPLVAVSVNFLAISIACGLPLLLAGYVLYVASRCHADDGAVGELLIDELAADRSPLLPPSEPRLTHQPRNLPSTPAPPAE
jgi:hypothetical protein